MGSLPSFSKTVTLEALENLGYSEEDWFTFRRIPWLTQKERELFGTERKWPSTENEFDTKIHSIITEWNIRDLYSENGAKLEPSKTIKDAILKMPGTLVEYIFEIILQDQISVADPMALLNLARKNSN